MGKNEETIQYLQDKSVLVGHRKRTLVDQETGEILQVDQVNKLNYGSKHFWKCYLKEFMSVLKQLEGKQLQVLVYIVEHTKPSTNEFTGTYANIIKDVGCCRQTVAATMVKLQKCDFMRKKIAGVWLINPDILVKGNDNKRNIISSEYETLERIKENDASKSEKKP